MKLDLDQARQLEAVTAQRDTLLQEILMLRRTVMDLEVIIDNLTQSDADD